MVTSLDFMPGISAKARWQFITVNSEGAIAPRTIQTDSLCVRIGNRGNVVFARDNRICMSGPGIDIVQGPIATGRESISDHEAEPSATTSNASSSPRLGHYVRKRRDTIQSISLDMPLFSLENSVSRLLTEDVSSVMYYRALSGYSLDPAKNGSIVAKSVLRKMWRWLHQNKVAAEDDKMEAHGIDLTFQGVLGIWRIATSRKNQTNSNTSNAVSALNKRLQRDLYIGTSANKSARQLALNVCGWSLGKKEMEDMLNGLVAEGNIPRAAFYSMAQNGNIEQAVGFLAQGSADLRIVSTAAAGYIASREDHGSAMHAIWKESCKRLAIELDNPYIRAIFAFVSNGDWTDVLDEQGLTLHERIGVALRYLSDEDLTLYLQAVARTEIYEGNVEGIMLTGLTTEGINLLQEYVDRTADVQTAALAAAMNPAISDDPRVTTWIDAYRSLLNSWNLFHVRAKFDIARNADSSATTQIGPAKQVLIRCSFCNAVCMSVSMMTDFVGHS